MIAESLTKPERAIHKGSAWFSVLRSDVVGRCQIDSPRLLEFKILSPTYVLRPFLVANARACCGTCQQHEVKDLVDLRKCRLDDKCVLNQR